MYTVRAQHQVQILAPRAQVFAVLADYERYPELFAQVREVEVHARDEGVCRVSFAIDLVVHLRLTLRLVEDWPNTLRFTLADANLVQQMTGSWTLVEHENGAASQLTYAIEVKLAGQIPASVQQRWVTQVLPQMLDCVGRHAQARGSAAGTPLP
jgi:ribosome-associated toxin RatA of RatAB toxin-antitoxin module